MPFSSFIPLTNHFIRKPLSERINIVKRLWKIRTVAHVTLFTTAYAIPNMKMQDDVIDLLQDTI